MEPTLPPASMQPATAPSAPEAPSPAVRREAILRAALELFAERTYGATAVPDIAARAHVGTGTIYRHFASKECLANEVYRGCKTAMHDALRSALARHDDPRERFLALWTALAALASADPVALRFLELQHHEDYLDARSRALSDAVFATAEGFVRDSQAAGAMRAGEPPVVIALVFGAFVGLFKESCAGRFALDAGAVADAGETVWRMIAAD